MAGARKDCPSCVSATTTSLLSSYSVPGPVLGLGDSAANKAAVGCALLGLILWWGKQTIHKKTHKEDH